MRYRRATLRTWEGEEEASPGRTLEAKRLLPHRHHSTACAQQAGGTVLGPKGKAVAPNEIRPGGQSPVKLRF